LAVAIAICTTPLCPSQDCDHREMRIDDRATWDCMTPLSQTVLYFVPGPDPDSDPPAPGPEALPCFDFVLYVQVVSNRLEHLANLTESGYECLEGMTNEDFRRHQLADDFFKGVLLRLVDPEGGEEFVGVVIHNDQSVPLGGSEFTPQEAMYVMRHLRATFDEASVGELRYYPIGVAHDVARGWVDDPAISSTLDFEIHFGGVGSREFVRGDTNKDGREGLADAVYLLNFLYASTPRPAPDCADALDVNDDGRLGVADAIYLLYHLFIDARRIPPPHDIAGFDRTPDELPDCGEPLSGSA